MDTASQTPALSIPVDEEEFDAFLSVGSWLPPPREAFHAQGSTTGGEQKVSRSSASEDQPGLIPVEEPLRFPSPFKVSAYPSSGTYGNLANQHWQPFRPQGPGEDYLSQADPHDVQQPMHHYLHPHEGLPETHMKMDPTNEQQAQLLPRASGKLQSYGKHSGAPRQPRVEATGRHPKLFPHCATEPMTPGYSLVTVEQTPWYTSCEAEQDTQKIITALATDHPDEEELIHVLSRHSHPFEIASRKLAYRRKFTTPKAKELLDVVDAASGDLSSGFRNLVHALVAGPLELDAHILFRAMAGAGTNEKYIQLVLLGRTNHEIKAIAAQYEAISRRQAMVAGKEAETLRSAIEGDVRGNLRKLYFGILLATRRWEDPSTSIAHTELQGDILDLSAALTGELDVDKVLKYFVSASYHRLASISYKWQEITGDDDSLEQRIQERFHRDLEDALLYILSSARDKAMRDAVLFDGTLSKSRFQLGKSGRSPLRSTKQEEIALLAVKLVWQDQLLEGLPNPNEHDGIYKRGGYLGEVDTKYVALLRGNGDPAVRGDLLRKIQKETSGEFKRFLVELWSLREDISKQ